MDDVEKDIEKGAKNVPEDSASTSTTATSSAVKLSPTGGHKKYETAGGGKIPQLPRAPCMPVPVPCRRLAFTPCTPRQVGELGTRGPRARSLSFLRAPHPCPLPENAATLFFPSRHLLPQCNRSTSSSPVGLREPPSAPHTRTHARTHTRVCAALEPLESGKSDARVRGANGVSHPTDVSIFLGLPLLMQARTSAASNHAPFGTAAAAAAASIRPRC